MTGIRKNFRSNEAVIALSNSTSGTLCALLFLCLSLVPDACGVAVPRNQVDISVNVSGYSGKRMKVVGAHKTQFNKRTRSAYNVFVHVMRKEKFIIARNRDAGGRLVDQLNCARVIPEVNE